MEKSGYVYILASKKGGVLYTGVTSDLEQRILQHKQGTFEGFTKKYFVHKLVRFQEFPTYNYGINRIGKNNKMMEKREKDLINGRR